MDREVLRQLVVSFEQDILGKIDHHWSKRKPSVYKAHFGFALYLGETSEEIEIEKRFVLPMTEKAAKQYMAILESMKPQSMSHFAYSALLYEAVSMIKHVT